MSRAAPNLLIDTQDLTQPFHEGRVMSYQKLQLRTLEILDQAEGNDITPKLCDYFILGLVFLNIVAVVLESVSSLYSNYAICFTIFELISVVLFYL